MLEKRKHESITRTVEVNELLVWALLALVSLPVHTSHSVFFVTKVESKKFNLLLEDVSCVAGGSTKVNSCTGVFEYFLSILTTYRPYVEERKIS